MHVRAELGDYVMATYACGWYPARVVECLPEDGRENYVKLQWGPATTTCVDLRASRHVTRFDVETTTDDADDAAPLWWNAASTITVPVPSVKPVKNRSTVFVHSHSVRRR